MLVSGNIISGQFDEDSNEFSLQQVKHFFTETTINEEQLQNLYYYLKKHENDSEGQFITLYDQLPIRLSKEDVQLLIRDLEKVKDLYL